MPELSFGYSPCPNDTYMFSSIAEASIGSSGCRINPVLRDIEKLNAMAMSQVLDITKLSFYAYFRVRESYQLLQTGSAMGFGCGPVLISKKRMDRQEVKQSCIVFPGRWTTAHLLFRLWEPNADNRIFTTYDKVFQFLETGVADCGVIIHESRFVFNDFGFKLLIDLGEWWTKITSLPVPLGCIAVKKTIGDQLIFDIENILKLSIIEATMNPKSKFYYVRKFAQEMSDKILWKHICAFVNEFSLNFGYGGLMAIEKLYSMANKSKVIM